MNKQEFIALVDGLRKGNKNYWVQTAQIVDGRTVRYKAYNTWVQILEIDGIKHSNPTDQKVRDFKAFLEKSL